MSGFCKVGDINTQAHWSLPWTGERVETRVNFRARLTKAHHSPHFPCPSPLFPSFLPFQNTNCSRRPSTTDVAILDPVDLSLGGEPDNPELFLQKGRVLDRHGGSTREVASLPAVELRLVDRECEVSTLKLPRPGLVTS